MSNTVIQYHYRVMLVHSSVGLVILSMYCNVKYSNTVSLQGDAYT